MDRYNVMKLIFLEFLLVIVLFSSSYAEKGYLYITSTPDSAIVTIDGQQYERYFTPVLCTLAVGLHEIAITKEYYTVQTFNVIIQPEVVVKQAVAFVPGGKDSRLSGKTITVPSKLGQLTFITNPLGASVVADGKKIGEVTPTTLSNVPAGKHKYTIEYQFLKFDTTIEIIGDNPQTAMIDFRKFKGQELYSIMPHVKAKVVIVVPGCEYQQDEKTGALFIKGVDAEISIRTGDTSLALTHRELADFPAHVTDDPSVTVGLNKIKTRLPKTEFTYYFEPYIDAKLRFDIRTFTNKKKSAPRDSAFVSTHYHDFPAALNSGEEVNVRIYIEDDGAILFRYW